VPDPYVIPPSGDGADSSRVDPSTVQRRPTSPLATTGVSGTAVYGGFVQEIERNPDLSGSNKYRTFSNALANTSIVASGVRYFLNLVSRPLWKLEPPDLPGADELADKATLIMSDPDARTPHQRAVRRAATFRFYGFSLAEWTAYLRDDGLIGMLDIASRPQSTIYKWDVDEQGLVYGAIQTSPKTGIEIYLPRWKLIYLVDDALSDSPEGLGLLRHIAEPVRRLRRYEQLEGWGFETDLRGIPIGRAPLSALQELKASGQLSAAQLEQATLGLTNFLQGHVRQPTLGLMLDSITYEDRDTRRPSSERKWDVELLKADSTSQPEILRAIERLNREIARILGVEQLLLGDNGVGSFAMAKEKNHNFAIVIDSTLEELRWAFRRDWLAPIWRLNGWPKELMPEIKTDRLQFRDIDQVTSSLERMARAGALLMPDDPAINELRDQMGLSHPITIPDPIPPPGQSPAQPPPPDDAPQ